MLQTHFTKFIFKKEIHMKILHKLPTDCYLACSGGVDSMSVLTFLLKGNKNVELLFCHHGTETSQEAYDFLMNFSNREKLKIHVDFYDGNSTTEESYRNFRYEFFNKFTDKPIITCHHLNDNIETHLMSMISGTPKFIPYSRDNIIRPFLLVSKMELIKYAKRNHVVWVEDKTNTENVYSRNKIRNLVIPVLKEINPGLEKVYRNKCELFYKKQFTLSKNMI